MIAAPPIPSIGPEQRFAEGVANVEAAIDRLAAAMPQVNDSRLRPRLLAFVEGAQAVLASDAADVGLRRADHLAELRRGIRELAVPARDPELGPTVLAGLTERRSLDLGGSPVTDLSALACLTGLHTLDLTGTPVSDLAGLAGLQRLYLAEGQAVDLSPLANLKDLKKPDIRGAARPVPRENSHE